jgi:anti-sigma-K factor RskA
MTDKWQEADWNLFALGALDESIQQEMQEHLHTGCHACSRSYQEAVLIMDALAATVPPEKPSPHIADALLSRITQAQPLVAPVKDSKRRSSWLPWVAAAACALLALWLGVRLEQANQLLRNQRASSAAAAVPQPAKSVPGAAVAVPTLVPPNEPQASPPAAPRTNASQVRSLTAQLADLQAQKDAALAQLNQVTNELANSIEARNSLQTQLASAQEQIHAPVTDAHSSQAQLSSLTHRLELADATIAELRASKAWNAQVVEFLQSGPFRQVDLRAVDPGAGKATAVAFYAPDRGLLVLARALPRLEGEKCFQLWSIHKAGPAIRSVGLMKTDASGGGFLFAPPEQDLRQLTALAITDEPKGGSLAARGHKLLFGAFN